MLFFPDCSTVIRGAPRLVFGTPSYSEGQQECPPRVWYSPEIDASKFTLHILPDTPGGFQWLKYILLMLCNATHRLGDGKRVILLQMVRSSIRAVRAIRNTWVVPTETKVVADEYHWLMAMYLDMTTLRSDRILLPMLAASSFTDNSQLYVQGHIFGGCICSVAVN